MARNFGVLSNSAKVALLAATAKTVLQVVAGANVRLAVQAVSIMFDGTSNTNTPVLITLMRQTTAGTMTGRATVQKDSDIATTLLCTGQENATVEPTSGAILLQLLVHPQAGVQYPLPLPGEFMAPGSGRIGLVINAPQAVNCVANIEFEE